jgi:hypothetical protein
LSNHADVCAVVIQFSLTGTNPKDIPSSRPSVDAPCRWC